MGTWGKVCGELTSNTSVEGAEAGRIGERNLDDLGKIIFSSFFVLKFPSPTPSHAACGQLWATGEEADGL
jgi:hypothetical protein